MFYGIDVGSTYTKIIGLDDSKNIIDMKVFETSINPDEKVKNYLSDKKVNFIVATGYGRNMIKDALNTPTVSEIKAHAKGSYYFFNDVKTVLDLGGQDSKVIKISENGNFDNFKMNDKCAAGTGKFIEIVASRLEIPLDNFGEVCQKATKKIKTSSMCAVFAESEVISLIAKKEKPENIGYGIADSVATRLVSLAKSLTIEDRVVFTGGGAKNILLQKLISEKIGKKVFVPKYPQMVGAFGSALIGIEIYQKEKS